MNQLLTTCFYHAGAYVNCLIAYAVFLNSWRTGLKFIFLLFFSALATFSDMLYLVMLAAPVFVSVLLTLKKSNLKQNIFPLVSIALGAVMGLKVYNYMHDSGITFFYRPYKMFEYSNILPALKVFTGQIGGYLLIPGFRSFQIVFAFLSIPVIAILLVLKRKTLSSEIKFFLVLVLMFSVFGLSAPIINGNYTGFDTLRYNVAVFYFSTILLAIFVAYLIEYKIPKEKLKLFVSGTLLSLFLIMTAVKFSPSGLKTYADYYPDFSREMDSLCNKYQLTRGISHQVHAKFLTAFSKTKLEVLTVHPTACIWELGSSINWYYDKDFDFILTHGINDVDFSKAFKITDTIHTKEFIVLKVQKFHYPRGTYAPVTK